MSDINIPAPTTVEGTMQFFKKFFRNESGATAIEYGLIAALIAVALLAIFSSDSKSADSEQAITKTTEEFVPEQ
jgi:Flp pilus assembly pilin Flp